MCLGDSKSIVKRQKWRVSIFNTAAFGVRYVDSDIWNTGSRGLIMPSRELGERIRGREMRDPRLSCLRLSRYRLLDGEGRVDLE